MVTKFNNFLFSNFNMNDFHSNALEISDNTASQTRPEGRKSLQVLAAVLVSLCAFASGNVVSWTALAVPLINAENGSIAVDNEEASWIGGLVAIGGFVGCLPAGHLSDIFGRKAIIIVSAVPFLIGWIMIILANSVPIIYAARFIAGLGSGLTSVAIPMYLTEIAEVSNRGALGLYLMVLANGGILFTYVVGSVTSYFWFCVTCSFLPVIFVSTYVWMPDSPVYLVAKNKIKEAKRSLNFLRGNEYPIDKEISEIQAMLEESNSSKGSFRDLLSSRTSMKALMIPVGLVCFVQFSGLAAIVFYSVQIFNEANSSLSPEAATIVIGSVQLVATYASSFLVDRAGRRALLLFSNIVMALCMCGMGTYFYLKEQGTDITSVAWLPLLFLTVDLTAASIGATPIPFVLMGEVLPPKIRGLGSAITMAILWCLVFVVSKVFQDLIQLLGFGVTFLSFSFMCILGTVFVFLVVPETKGKSLNEIQNELAGGRQERRNYVY